MIAPRAVALPLLAAALAGCRARGAEAARDSTFVATMTALRTLQRTAPADTASRMAALRRGGYTRASLEKAARELAKDPSRAARAWEQIENAGNATPLPPSTGQVPIVPPGAPAPPSPRPARRSARL